MAVYDLFFKFSYRYTKVELRSFLSPLRYLKAALQLLLRRRAGSWPEHAQYVTYDGKMGSKSARLNYLAFIGYPPSFFIARDELPNELSPLRKLFGAAELLLVFLVVFPAALFHKDKAKPSLILLELTEALLISEALKKVKCSELLVLSASEKDIVFFCHFIRTKLKIKVSIQPSFNPIHFYYQHVICDTFIFTAAFQKFEYETLKRNWIYKNTAFWPPFGCDAIKINPQPNAPEPEVKVGLMSSCSALREHLGHTNSTSNADYLSEKALISALQQLQSEGHLNKIIVFFHPLEKANAENLEFSKTYYQKLFSNVEFAPFDKASKQCFDLCTVSVSGFSSSQIERLYGGYKTLFAPMGFLKNYFSDPRLDAISVQDHDELKNRLKEMAAMSADDFFTHYNLQDYRWDAFLGVNLT